MCDIRSACHIDGTGAMIFYVPNIYTGEEFFENFDKCKESLRLTRRDYRHQVGRGCPAEKEVEKSFQIFYKKNHHGHRYTKALDPYYMDSWPAFNSGATKFVGSPEYNGMKTVANVVTIANDYAGAPTDGYAFLDGNKVLPKEKQNLDMMLDLLNNMWLAPKHKAYWEKMGGNNIHIGDNKEDANIDSFSVNKGVNLSFGLILI